MEDFFLNLLVYTLKKGNNLSSVYVTTVCSGFTGPVGNIKGSKLSLTPQFEGLSLE